MVIAGGQIRKRNGGHDPDASTEPAMVIAGGRHLAAADCASALPLQRSRRW